MRNSRNAPPWHFFPSARLRLVRANQNSLRKELLAERRHAWFSARGRINFVNEWPPCGQTNQPDGNWNNVRGYVCAHVKFLNVSLILRIWRRKMSKPFLVCPSLFVRDGIFIAIVRYKECVGDKSDIVKVKEKKRIIFIRLEIANCRYIRTFLFFPFDLSFHFSIARIAWFWGQFVSLQRYILIVNNFLLSIIEKRLKISCLLLCKHILTFEVKR